jgi:hypothetical protein
VTMAIASSCVLGKHSEVQKGAALHAHASCCASACNRHFHHHHVTQSSHSINAIGPVPLWSGRKREHCSIMFATITHIPSLHKILLEITRHLPLLPQISSDAKRNNLVEASGNDNTLVELGRSNRHFDSSQQRSAVLPSGPMTFSFLLLGNAVRN